MGFSWDFEALLLVLDTWNRLWVMAALQAPPSASVGCDSASDRAVRPLGGLLPDPFPTPISQSHLPVPVPFPSSQSHLPASIPSYGTPFLVSPCLSSSTATFHVCREMHPPVKIHYTINSIDPTLHQNPATSLVYE